MTPEGKVKLAVKKRLKQLGAYQFWPVQTGYGTRTLDCIGFYKGKGFAIETKRPGGKPTARQQITIDEIRDAGGIVLIIDSVEKANDFAFDDDL